MSILQELKESLESDAPCFIEFLYRYDPKKKQVFVFYEGDEDSAFYQQFIRNTIGEDCQLEEIVAGCKNNVIKLQRTFNWSVYNKQQVIFIVDRDLSYWLGEPDDFDENVFVTDGYSVENYLVNASSFEDLLVKCLGFARAKKQEISFMVSEFQKFDQNFRNSMRLIMASAVIAKQKDKNADIGKYKPVSAIVLNLVDTENPISIPNTSKMFDLWNLNDRDNASICSQLKAFDAEPEKYFVRGKWHLEFMAKVGNFMRVNGELFAPSLKKQKISPTCAVSDSQYITVLAPYWKAPMPHRLKAFLESTVGGYSSAWEKVKRI